MGYFIVYLERVVCSLKVVLFFHKREGILIPKSGKFIPLKEIFHHPFFLFITVYTPSFLTY